MPVNTRSRGYKKKPGVEPAGSPGSTPISPGVYIPPEESLPDYSPPEATPSGGNGIIPAISAAPKSTEHDEILKAAEEKAEHTGEVIGHLLGEVPSLTGSKGNPLEKENPVLANYLKSVKGEGFTKEDLPAANIGASSQYATPAEEGKLEVKPLSAFADDDPPKPKPSKPEASGPLTEPEAVKALEEQGTPSRMAAKLAANPAIVTQLEAALDQGFGNTPHPTEEAPGDTGQLASTAILSSNPKGKQHQELLKAAEKKAEPKDSGQHVLAQMKQGLQPAEQDLLPYVLRAHEKFPDIPVSVMMAQIKQESGFDPSAESSAGAFGATQFIPETAESYNVERGTGPKEIQSQVDGQANLLHDDNFAEDPQGALSAYSGGYAESEYNNPILEDAKANYSHLDELAGGATNIAPPTADLSGPRPVPKAERHYFEDNGTNTHLKFVPTFAKALVKLAKLSGEPVQVNDGWRSLGEEQEKWQIYQEGGNLAAEPGTSEHGKGLAADLNLTSHQRELLSAAGLDLPVAGEDWHVQLSDPDAIAQAAAEASPTSGVPAPSGSVGSVAPSLSSFAMPATESGSGLTGTGLLNPSKPAEPEDQKTSYAMQLLFGGGENEDPVNALLESPLPDTGPTTESLTDEELLKLLLERA